MTVNVSTNPVNSSGAISFSSLRNKLKESSSGNVSLSELYRNGSYVPTTSTSSSVPTSGPIAVSNFYGVNISAIATITGVEQNLNANVFGSDYSTALKKQSLSMVILFLKMKIQQ